MIDLDNNATTRPTPEVIDAVVGGLERLWHNPSSVHRGGQEARHALELARAALAELINAEPRQVVLCSSGTESIDLALRGTLGARQEAQRTLVTTRVEHAAVRDLAEDLERRGEARVVWAPLAPDRSGLIDMDGLDAALAHAGPGAIVSVQWANNETGAVQPVEAVGRVCRSRGAVFHCDGVQWVGREPTDVNAAPFDMLSFSPHKFHGPKGVGVLWSRRGVRLRPAVLGSQELGRRGGTENVPGILGAGVAARQAIAWLADADGLRRGRGLRDRFESQVLAAVPDAAVNAPSDPGLRLWNTSNIAFPGLEAEALLLTLSEAGLAASAGAACSSGSLEPSPVLRAMGVPDALAHGSLRFSLSRDTTQDEVDRAAALVAGAVRRLRGIAAAPVSSSP